MNSSGALPYGLRHPVQFLKEELAPYPGRLNLVLRVLLSSAVVIVVSMTLEVPLLFLSLFATLYVTQANLVVTRVVAIGALVAATMVVGGLILLLKFTYDYPLLRIIGMSAVTFGSLFMMRASKVGLLFFLVAMVFSFGQTYVDQTDNAELLVRAFLWVWVAVVYPAMSSVLINTILIPAEPQTQLKAEIHRQLQAIDGHLRYMAGGGEKPTTITLPAVQKGALALQKQLKLTMMRDKAYKAEQARHLATIATVSRLYLAASTLPQEQVSENNHVDVINSLREACQALDSAIAADQPFVLPGPLTTEQPDAGQAALAEMQTALKSLADSEAHPPAPPPAQGIKKSLFVADAFTNPVYPKFALKTLFAVLITWTFYNAVDWPGIHTSMMTCVILAQSSLGASVRKTWLRIFGVAIGSFLALFMMVFVIPNVETIVGMLAMTLPVIAIASWAMSGSPRISYGGFQIFCTFALGLLGSFTPSTNLTEVRDRIMGVVIGVIVSTLVQNWIWPESEGKTARQRLAGLLEAIGKLIRPVREGITSAVSVSVSQQQLGVLTKLSDCESMLARVALEPSGQDSQQEDLNLALQTVLAQARSLMLAANTLHGEFDPHEGKLPDDVREAVFSVQEQVATALDRYAGDLRGDEGCRTPPPIPLDALAHSLAGASPAISDKRRSAIQKSAQNLVQQLSNLPEWSVSEPTPAGMKMVHDNA